MSQMPLRAEAPGAVIDTEMTSSTPAIGYWQRAFRHIRHDRITVFAFFCCC